MKSWTSTVEILHLSQAEGTSLCMMEWLFNCVKWITVLWILVVDVDFCVIGCTIYSCWKQVVLYIVYYTEREIVNTCIWHEFVVYERMQDLCREEESMNLFFSSCPTDNYYIVSLWIWLWNPGSAYKCLTTSDIPVYSLYEWGTVNIWPNTCLFPASFICGGICLFFCWLRPNSCKGETWRNNLFGSIRDYQG